MTFARIIAEDLGGSSLARAAQRGELPDWFRPRPRDTAGWQEYLGEVARPHADGEWLRALAPALAPSGRAAMRLRHVADAGGVVVSTGQQAALFGGPLYTLLKALSALAIADVLERETGVPAVPVFWAATDDADFAEASTATVAVTGGVQALRLNAPPQPALPMSRVALDETIAALVRGLEEACGSVADDAPLVAVRSSHRPGTTLGNAYVHLLRELLEPLGVAVLDAFHPAVRAAAAPVSLRALDQAEEVEDALLTRASAIRAAGFTPQVDHIAGLSLVFADGATGERQRIPIREAAEAGRQYAPELLGPNVLLRPLVERSLLPSAAYVAGPGEIAYFAQVSAVAAVLGVPTPLAVPRCSVTIVEPRIERLLDRLGIGREELRDPHAVESRLARAALPEQIATALRTLRRDVESDVAALESADEGTLVPRASVDALRRSLLQRIERAERRYAAAVKRIEAERMRDVATARGALYPLGSRQERVLNFIPFLVRYGVPLLTALHAEAERQGAAATGVSWRRDTSGASVAERV